MIMVVTVNIITTMIIMTKKKMITAIMAIKF